MSPLDAASVDITRTGGRSVVERHKPFRKQSMQLFFNCLFFDFTLVLQ